MPPTPPRFPDGQTCRWTEVRRTGAQTDSPADDLRESIREASGTEKDKLAWLAIVNAIQLKIAVELT